MQTTAFRIILIFYPVGDFEISKFPPSLVAFADNSRSLSYEISTEIRGCQWMQQEAPWNILDFLILAPRHEADYVDIVCISEIWSLQNYREAVVIYQRYYRT